MSKENQAGQMFLYFFSRKTCAPGLYGAISHHPSHHGFPRRSGAAPSTVNTGPRAPIFEYMGHQHGSQAWRPPMGAAQARYGFYCHRNAWYVEIRSKNHGGILPSIMAAERSNGAPGGARVRPIPPHECPYSSMLATDMCTKAVRRGKLIGVVRGDEFTIALSDVPWIYKKVHLVSGPTLNIG